MNSTTFRNDPAESTDLVQLAAQARLAYEQKRTKECVALTKQLLLADEGNAEAQVLQSAIQSDIQRDLNDARALLEESRRMADGQRHRKAAEIILLKILYLDPAHDEAKALLDTAKGASGRGVTERSAAEKGATETRPAPVSVEAPKRHTRADDEMAFTARPEPVKLQHQELGRSRKLPFILVASVLALLAGGYFLIRSGTPAKATASATAPASPAATPSADLKSASVATSPAPLAAANSKIPDHSSPSVAVPIPPVPAVAPASSNVAPPKAAVAAEPGSLAVSSPTPADIYVGDKYLGATPTTLQLPPGRQTLEYRHGDLRTVMTHEIKSKETTTALVTFEVVVQINARPWAQVFIEGTTRKPLGQTPVSSVRVPIGSVLTFENPNFPPKSHRVTETDSTIQMAFP